MKSNKIRAGNYYRFLFMQQKQMLIQANEPPVAVNKAASTAY